MSLIKDAFRKQFAELATSDLRAAFDALTQEIVARLKRDDYDGVEIDAHGLTVLRMDGDIPEQMAAGRMCDGKLVSPDAPDVGNTGELNPEEDQAHPGDLLSVLEAIESDMEEGAAVNNDVASASSCAN